MWNTFTQAAGLSSAETDDNKDDNKSSILELEQQLQQQQLLNQQLKDLLRENETRYQEKDKELQEITSTFQKFKLQSKAKISHLSSQIKEREKPLKKEDCDFDESSSSDSSDHTHRGKVLFLKKQLEQARQQLGKKEEECKKLSGGYERKITDLEAQLNEKNILISSIIDGEEKRKTEEKSSNKSPQKESNIQEMYAQIVYKDSKIMELNSQILELEKKIIDLQETVKEKDEVLLQRNRAVQLMAEDLSRKGQTVVGELDETRHQMKIMQENFASVEVDWKAQLDKYKAHIAELEKDIIERDKKLKNSETIAKNLEVARYELSVKNAELQKKIVLIQDSASKQCEIYNKEIGGELEILKKKLEVEKKHSEELQKALDDSSSQSENKILKARVKERTKLKAMERELNALKKTNDGKPEEVLELQQRIAELEEDKGTLQLKIMEFEDQIVLQDKLRKENEVLQNTAEEALLKVQQLEEQNKKLLMDKEISEQKLESLNNDLSQLEEKFANVNKEKLELQEKFHSHSIFIDNIEKEYNKLKEQHSDLENIYNETAQTLQLLKDQKVAFELKTVELEEMKEKDEKVKRDLLSKILQLEEDRPVIELEGQNLDLKEKLNIATHNYSVSEQKTSELLAQIDDLQKKLTDQENKCSSQTAELMSKLRELKEDYNTLQKELEYKALQFAEKDKEQNQFIEELSNFRDELQEVFTLVDVKNVHEFKAYVLSKAEEYSVLKCDCDKAVEVNKNLLCDVQTKDSEIQNHILIIDKLKSDLEKQAIQLKSQESHISLLNNNLSEQNSLTSTLRLELQEKIDSEKILIKTIEEQAELLKKSEQHVKNLNHELENLKNIQKVEHEKVQSKMLSLLDQISDLESELSSLRDELNSKIEVNKSLQEEILVLKTENINSVQTLENEKMLLAKNMSETFKSDIKFLEEALASLKLENEDLKAAIKKKDSDSVTAREKLDHFNVSINEMMQAIIAKDELITELQEKIVSLEQNTFSEKEGCKKLSEENLYLKTQTVELEKQIESLSSSLSSKTEECESLKLKHNEMESLLQRNEKHKFEISNQLDETQKELETLKIAFENQFSQFQEKEKLCQNVMGENSMLQNNLTEMNNTIKEQQLQMDNFVSTVQLNKKQYEEISNKVSILEHELEISRAAKIELEEKKLSYEAEIKNLHEENAVLKDNIANLNVQHQLQVTNLSEEIAKYNDEIQSASEKLLNYQAEKQDLINQYNSLQTALNNYELTGKSQEDEINQFCEKNNFLEQKVLDLAEKVKNYEEQIKILQNDIEISSNTYSTEMSEMQTLLQNSMTRNDQLVASLSEFEGKINSAEEGKQNIESTNTYLQSLLNENEKQIMELKLSLTEERVKASNLQNIINENQIEYENYKHSSENKLCHLQNIKKYFYRVLQDLSNSCQLNIDVSFLESENFFNKSINEIDMEFKNTLDVVNKNAVNMANELTSLHLEVSESKSENESLSSLCKAVNKEVEILKVENVELKSECKSLKDNVSKFAYMIEENSVLNESKLSVILSSIHNKIALMEKVKSETTILAKVINRQKNQISVLESNKESLLKELQNLGDANSEANRLIIDLENERDKIIRLETSLRDITDSYNSLSEAAAIKQNTLENCQRAVQELQDSLHSKEETITKMVQEQQNNENNLLSLQSELACALSSISLLQSEVGELKRQCNEYPSQSQSLETSHNVSNGLQVEVENLQHDLAVCEDQRNSLQQRLDNVNLQLQLCLNERNALESNIEQMQHKLNDTIEENKHLSDSLGETQTLLSNKAEHVKVLEQQHLECKTKYDALSNEFQSLQLSVSEYELNKERALQIESNLSQQNLENLKHVLCGVKTLCSKMGDADSINFFMKSLTANIQGEDCLKVISEICTEFINLAKLYESTNKKLSQEVEVLKELLQVSQSKLDPGENSAELTTEKCVSTPDTDRKLVKELPQAQSVPFNLPEEAFCEMKNENESLKTDINVYKMKFDKMMTKLKIFKARNEKLTNDLKLMNDKYAELVNINNKSLEKENELQELLTKHQDESEKLLLKLEMLEKERKLELNKCNDIISELKKRSALLEDECCIVKQELQEYKQTWEQTNVPYELQKEDNENLRVKLHEATQKVEDFSSTITKLNLQTHQLENENTRLKQEVINLREHASMLLSDNDTYQNLIEKLTAAKSSLEKKLLESKEKHDSELQKVEKKCSEIAMDDNRQKNGSEFQAHISNLENECASFKKMHLEMQLHCETLQRQFDSCLRNKNLLEKEKVYLQQQLLEKAQELDNFKIKFNDVMNNPIVLSSDPQESSKRHISLETSSSSNNNFQIEIDALKEENRNLKSSLDSLTQEINLAATKFQLMQQENHVKESSYQNKILELEGKFQEIQNKQITASCLENKNEISNVTRLENELQQAMSSLHNLGLRSEELSSEVSRLLEERNHLKWKLQQYQNHSAGSKTSLREDSSNISLSQSISTEVDSPVLPTEIKNLRDRLNESEKKCQELYRANEALDRALIGERQQKKIIEDELDLAKEHLSDEAHVSNEYRILLGDVDEPELFEETNFSISRNVKTHAYKLRRWLRGRRNYLCRTVKSRNYPQLIYLFYLVFIHLWLLTCTLR